MKEKRDDELLREFRRGNVDAFTEFVRRYQDAIYRLSLQNLDDEYLAREAAQEVFIRAWKKLGRWRIRSSGKPFSWLYRTMKNVCRELIKRKQREKRMIKINENYLEHKEESSKEHMDFHKHLFLKKLVNALPDRQQEVVVLHIYEGRTLSDVAKVLGIPVGTVKSNYHKALQNLRHVFKRYAKEDESASAL